MKSSFLALAILGTLSLLLSLCKGADDDAKATSADLVYSCSMSKEDVLQLCMEYVELSGNALDAVAADCQTRTEQGYAWSVSSCRATGKVGKCDMLATTSRPAPSTHSYYSPNFDLATAQGMCEANSGTFTAL